MSSDGTCQVDVFRGKISDVWWTGVRFYTYLVYYTAFVIIIIIINNKITSISTQYIILTSISLKNITFDETFTCKVYMLNVNNR